MAEQITRDFSIAGSMRRPGASALVKRLRSRQALVLVRDPKDQYDPNTIIVVWGNKALGYLPRGLAAEVAPLMDAGVKVIAQKAANAMEGVCSLAWVPTEGSSL